MRGARHCTWADTRAESPTVGGRSVVSRLTQWVQTARCPGNASAIGQGPSLRLAAPVGTPKQKQGGDKGIDGVIRFFADVRGKVPGRVLVSVKGGGKVGPAAVREIGGTVETRKAEMGLLITMAPRTPGMIEEANHAGTYTWPVNGRPFDRIQIATVPDLLAGKRPDLPPALTPYIAAGKHIAPADQMALDVD